MVIVITGHQRSGTTLLRNLCDSHPNVTITMEFANLRGLDSSFKEYKSQLLQNNPWKTGRALDSSYAKKERMNLRNFIFVMRYLLNVRRYCKGTVGFRAIEAALESMFPKSRVVGDKWPDYIFLVDKLVEVEGLSCLVVYRDCRDVTSSTLRMARTQWANQPWVKWMDTAEKVAERWVNAIELMEQHAEKLHIIRYEDLVQRPEQELEKLGQWFDVDPARFPVQKIQSTNVSKYKSGLSDEELASVMEVAGPTMARLGYV